MSTCYNVRVVSICLTRLTLLQGVKRPQRLGPHTTQPRPSLTARLSKLVMRATHSTPARPHNKAFPAKLLVQNQTSRIVSVSNFEFSTGCEIPTATTGTIFTPSVRVKPEGTVTTTCESGYSLLASQAPTTTCKEDTNSSTGFSLQTKPVECVRELSSPFKCFFNPQNLSLKLSHLLITSYHKQGFIGIT